MLDELQQKELQNTQQDIEALKVILAFAQANHLRTYLRDLLKVPDVTVDYNAAAGKRYADTGAWLTQSAAFKGWLQQDNSFLWLCGPAGSGKSVLCSTAIQQVIRQRRLQTNSAIAFFFFTFNDHAKQDVSALLRALLVQLSGQILGIDAELLRLSQSSKGGIIPATKLVECLRQTATGGHDVHILIDALDECQASTQREEVLHTIETIRGWALRHLHLLVTSRNLVEIRDALHPRVHDVVTLENKGVEDDIRRYITHCVEHDPKLQRWKDKREVIKDHLVTYANGVFRWVDCQLEPLRRCPLIKNCLRRYLELLPLTLDETYERILCNIDEHMQQDAKRVLELLCLATRELSVDEIIEALAVDIHDSERYDSNFKLESSDDLLRICPGLIDIVHVPTVIPITDNSNAMKHGLEDYTKDDVQEHDHMAPPPQIVRIAHFSVREYLFSDRIRKGRAASFAVCEDTGHMQISKTCLIYLCNQKFLTQALTPKLLRRYVFTEFAAVHWFYHFSRVRGLGKQQLESCALALFQTEQAFCRWSRLYNVDAVAVRRSSIVYDVRPQAYASPVYCVASLGLHNLLGKLLESPWSDVVEQRRRHNTALQAASENNHELVVQMLLKAGANVNAKGGSFGTALEIASDRGHDQIVRMLINAGAEINNGLLGCRALTVATTQGHEHIVRALLSANADVNTQGICSDSPLHVAIMHRHVEIAQILLDAGADVEICRQQHSRRPLYYASSTGCKETVRIILDAGADVNAQEQASGSNALQAASEGGHEHVVQVLIEAGANINARGGWYGTALVAALAKGNRKVVRMLLDTGADSNGLWTASQYDDDDDDNGEL